MKKSVATKVARARSLYQKCVRSRDYKSAERHATYIASVSSRRVAGGWYHNAASCAARDQRFQTSITLALKAIELGDSTPNLYAILSHAFSETGDFEKMEAYGKALLERKDACSSRLSITDQWKACEVASDFPSLETKERNIIAFSLFGSLPKYCEGAIMNAEAAAAIYPHWTPMFYVDDTVPLEVIAALESKGALVKEARGKTAPKTMWRFEACDEQNVDRVIFRDADSIVNPREAHAVQEWVESSRCFHTMRDGGSHTALILAGMWGCSPVFLNGCSITKAMEQWLQTASGNEFDRFADQYFLAEAVWPIARELLFAHDSVFGFGDSKDFDVSIDGKVGDNMSTVNVTVHCAKPPRSEVTWHLRDIATKRKLTCSYCTVTKDSGDFVVSVPQNFIAGLQQGSISVRTEG